MKKITALLIACSLLTGMFGCSQRNEAEITLSPENSVEPASEPTPERTPEQAPEQVPIPTPAPTPEPTPPDEALIAEIMGDRSRGIPGSNYLQTLADMEACGFYDFANPENEVFPNVYQKSIMNYDARVDLTSDIIHNDQGEINDASFNISSIGADTQGFYEFADQFWTYCISSVYKGELQENALNWLTQSVVAASEEASFVTLDNIEFSISILKKSDGSPNAGFLRMEYVG